MAKDCLSIRHSIRTVKVGSRHRGHLAGVVWIDLAGAQGHAAQLLPDERQLVDERLEEAAGQRPVDLRKRRSLAGASGEPPSSHSRPASTKDCSAVSSMRVPIGCDLESTAAASPPAAGVRGWPR